MLSREQRDKWADALESGEFIQTQRYKTFHTFDSELQKDVYCALGVFGKVCFNRTDLDLYPIFNDLLGEGLKWKIIDMNDGNSIYQEKPLSFKEIAAFVRTLPVSEDDTSPAMSKN